MPDRPAADLEPLTAADVAGPDPGAAMRALLEAGVPVETRRAYRRDRREWAEYCAREGLSVMPVGAEAVASFAAELLTTGSPLQGDPRPLAATSVARRLAALSTWSAETGHGRPDLRIAKVALRGHRRLAPVAPKQAAPATVGVLRALVQQTVADEGGRPSARGARDRCLVLLGFAIAARRSELVSLDLGDVLARPEGLVVRVRRSKTGERLQEVAVPRATLQPELCAVLELKTILARRGITTGPMFRRVTRTDSILTGRLTAQSVRLVVAKLAEAAEVPVPSGYSAYAADSLRRGMATESRRAGHDALAIARAGGWADGSTALNRYLADVDAWQRNALDGVL